MFFIRGALISLKAMTLNQEQVFTINFAVEHWDIEKLRPEYREAYLLAKSSGLGVCPKCRC